MARPNLLVRSLDSCGRKYDKNRSSRDVDIQTNTTDKLERQAPSAVGAHKAQEAFSLRTSLLGAVNVVIRG